MSKKILIFGSCVSRDVLSMTDNSATLVNYYARSTYASAFLSPKIKDNISNNNESIFQGRMVKYDFEKTFREKLITYNFDILLLDFIDERLKILEPNPGEYITLSNELIRCNFDFDGIKVIEGFTEEHFLLWQKGWEKFINLAANADSIHKIRIPEVYWNMTTIQGKASSDDFSVDEIDSRNAFLEKKYNYCRKFLESKNFLRIDKKGLRGDENHPWGRSPFHYSLQYYVDIANQLDIINIIKINKNLSTVVINGSIFTDNGNELIYETNKSKQIKISIIIDTQDLVEKNFIVSFLNYGDILKNKNPDKIWRSPHDVYGWYSYINFKDGKSDLVLNIDGLHELKLHFKFFSINNYSLVNIKYFEIAPFYEINNQKKASISIDVEALIGRARSNHVDKLIWGKYENGTAGIFKLCDIFKSLNIPATFYLEYSSCEVYGDNEIFSVGKYIQDQGFDVQLHLHPEILIRSGILKNSSNEVFFNNLDLDTCIKIIKYGIEKYALNFGTHPRIFRPGGMLHCENMYEACRINNINSVSAIFKGHDKEIWNECMYYKFFKWNNGVKEIPLDLSLDPLIKLWTPFESYIEDDKSNFIQLLIHSWSLSLRDKDGYHESYSSESENNLIAYIELLHKKSYTFYDHKSLLNDHLYEHSNEYLKK
jgi:hypothetical protein